jgi:hypothetical protein
MRGPKAGTGIPSPNVSTFMTAWWWHRWQATESERTPSSRMLASVIGEPPDQLGGRVLVEHAADRRGRDQRRGGLVEFVALGERRALVDAVERHAHAGMNEAGGIRDDDTL